MNSLQERVDLLAVKVTQLDSTVEEGWRESLHSDHVTIQRLHLFIDSVSLLCASSLAAGHQYAESF